MKKILVCLLLLVMKVSVYPCFFHYTFSGTVERKTTFDPIPYAHVVMFTNGWSIKADADGVGHYTLPTVCQGAYYITGVHQTYHFTAFLYGIYDGGEGPFNITYNVISDD